MKYRPPKAPEPTWRTTGWRSCQDVHIPGDVEGVPRYLRCIRCFRLVTHGQIQTGGCVCGFRKLQSCHRLTWAEIILLKLGWFRLKSWERQAIRPLLLQAVTR